MCVSVPNFVAIGGMVTEILQFFDFQDGGRSLSWIFSNGSKFKWLFGFRGLVCVILLNFVAIEIWPFIYFLIWQPSAILDLLCARLDHPPGAFVGLYRSAKFGWNQWKWIESTQ